MIYPFAFSRDKATVPNSFFSAAFSTPDFLKAAYTLTDVLEFGSLDLEQGLVSEQKNVVTSLTAYQQTNERSANLSQIDTVWGWGERLEYNVRHFSYENKRMSFKPPLAKLVLDFRTPDRLQFYTVLDASRLQAVIDYCCDVERINDTLLDKNPQTQSFYKLAETLGGDVPAYN